MWAIPLAAAAVVMLIVIAWDRLREPHRDLRRPFAIGGRRDYRDACRRVDRLIAEDDFEHAWAGAMAIRTWLKSERHYGGHRRRRALGAAYETWSAKCEEFNYLPSPTAP